MTGWESLREDAQDPPRCSIAGMLRAVPETSRDYVRQVLDDPSVGHVALRRALLERLGPACPSIYSLKWHRARNCACRKDDPDG